MTDNENDNINVAEVIASAKKRLKKIVMRKLVEECEPWLRHLGNIDYNDEAMLERGYQEILRITPLSNTKHYV